MGISVRYDLWPVNYCDPYAAYSLEQGLTGQKLPGSGISIDSKVLTDIGRAFWAMAGLGGSRLWWHGWFFCVRSPTTLPLPGYKRLDPEQRGPARASQPARHCKLYSPHAGKKPPTSPPPPQPHLQTCLREWARCPGAWPEAFGAELSWAEPPNLSRAKARLRWPSTHCSFQPEWVHCSPWRRIGSSGPFGELSYRLEEGPKGYRSYSFES